MRRRDILSSSAGVGLAALAGCSTLVSTEPAGQPPVLDNRPNGVYYPTHIEGMSMVGTATAGEYTVALTYSYPHRFWTVDSTDVSMTPIGSDDDVHLMASVWDSETGQILPDTGLTLEITQDGGLVSEEVIYPMLSQPMGFHYGANFGLDGDGTYNVTVRVGAMSTRRSGAFAGRFSDPASATIEFEYARSAREEIRFERTPDRAGERAAVEPMSMEMLPTGFAPATDTLPGVVGTGTSGDARFVVGTLDAPPEGVDGDGQYLYVSARTPYNGMVIPSMAVAATTETFDGDLTATLDSEIGYHYGAVVDSVGDAVTVRPTVPPQTARHEGYETAFLQFDPVEVTR